MATIFREPIVTNQRPSRDPLQARQFISAGLALLTAVALPPGKAIGRELPAQKVSSYVNRSWTKTSELPRQLAVALPVGKAIGIRDLAAQKISVYLNRSWIEVNDLPRQLAVALPAGKRVGVIDLPKRIDSPLARDRQRVNDLPRQLATYPFAQSDWPLPDRRDSPLTRDRQRVNDLSRELATYPFAQSDWPPPDRRDSPLARDRQRINDLSRQLAVSLPYGLSDWALPKLARVRVPETLFPDGAILGVSPFAQFSWPNPLVVQFTVPAFDFVNLLPGRAPPPAPVTKSGAQRLVLSLRQAWARERFQQEVELAYGKLMSSVDVTGVEHAPKKVRAALRESIIQMIARLPQIVACLASGYTLNDVREVIAAMRRPMPNSTPKRVERVEPIVEDFRAERREIDQRVAAIEKRIRETQRVLDGTQREQDRTESLADAVAKRMREINAGIVESKAKQEAKQAKLAAAQEEIRRQQAAIDAERREAERIAKLRREFERLVKQAKVNYHAAIAEEARRKLAEIRRQADEITRRIDEAESNLSELDAFDDDEAITILGG